MVVERLWPGALDVSWANDDACVHCDLFGGHVLHIARHATLNKTAVKGSTGVCGIGVWPSGRNTSGGMEANHIGHSAFEEYRAQTLQRLDQEQREFQEFIARLRAAKDKEEFEQFITDRRMRPPSSQA